MNILDQTSSASPERIWSAYQQNIFDEALKNPQQSIQVSAVAGSGKSATIEELMRRLPGSSLFLAFNKGIAESIKARGVLGDVRTLNALGHRLWIQNTSGKRLDARRLSQLAKQVMPADVSNQWGYEIQSLVGMAKNSGVGLLSPPSLWDFCDLPNDFPTVRNEEFSLYAMRLFNLSLEPSETFDFDDQIYGPLMNNWKFPAYDAVLVDEDQDLGLTNHMMLGCLATQGARIIGVGDRHQAIYSFRGAMSNSLDALVYQFSMKELPLSISYRCPRAVVKEAQALCPEIQFRLGAPEGSLEWAESDPQVFYSPDQMILCRTNAPLFSAVMRQVRERVPCRVMSNALESLGSWIRKFKEPDLPSLLAKADQWLEKERSAMLALRPIPHGKLRNCIDKVETLRALAEDCFSTQEIYDLLHSLKNSQIGPLFATIHKAKGLEAPDVHLLRPDLCPAPWTDEGTEAYQQELNLLYVAITRAQNSFTYGAY